MKVAVMATVFVERVEYYYIFFTEVWADLKWRCSGIHFIESKWFLTIVKNSYILVTTFRKSLFSMLISGLVP